MFHITYHIIESLIKDYANRLELLNITTPKEAKKEIVLLYISQEKIIFLPELPSVVNITTITETGTAKTNITTK